MKSSLFGHEFKHRFIKYLWHINRYIMRGPFKYHQFGFGYGGSYCPGVLFQYQVMFLPAITSTGDLIVLSSFRVKWGSFNNIVNSLTSILECASVPFWYSASPCFNLLPHCIGALLPRLGKDWRPLWPVCLHTAGI